MQSAENPYESPQTFDIHSAPPPPPNHHEEIRRSHLNTEASIKSIGILYYISAIGAALAGVSVFFSGGTSMMIVGGVLVGIAAVSWITGSGLRKFDPWSRIVVTIVSVIGLLGFPIGTVISGYFLYLIFGRNAQMIFSPKYKEVLAATPHIKYKTPIGVWIIVAIIVGLILFVIGRAFLIK